MKSKQRFSVNGKTQSHSLAPELTLISLYEIRKIKNTLNVF
ncbi:hypothetical protein BN137_1652 [Cronobacter condimenti 1330]|uniref:Uncharacterized protein n=1 Tax=Cronobacter condimenti 1330 TaxID=1073999 RepID=K8ADD9_9ENTR|nr:hypothetical protein BN137_1652 [Cronobacter condimenti 1330]